MEELVKLTVQNQVLTAALAGEIDHHSAISIRQRIDEMLYRELPKMLVIDIGNVDFMDSSGLGLILGRYTKAKELGTTLVVANPTARSEKILKMAGIERMIQITKTSSVRKDG